MGRIFSTSQELKILVLAETAALLAGFLWSCLSAGISPSNAAGNVIRSSVSSIPAGLIMLIGAGTLSFTVAAAWLRDNRKLRRHACFASLAVAAASAPFLIYFNFY